MSSTTIGGFGRLDGIAGANRETKAINELVFLPPRFFSSYAAMIIGGRERVQTPPD